jgi:hypothetical protein
MSLRLVTTKQDDITVLRSERAIARVLRSTFFPYNSVFVLRCARDALPCAHHRTWRLMMGQRTAQNENRRRALRAARNAQLDAELASYSVKRWLSVPQWARARGISVWFAYSQARNGRLKITKAGRRSFITPEADTAWSNSLPVLNSSAVASVDRTAQPTSPIT